MHTFFAYLARMKYIQRWGLMRNSFPENDAEHTLQTVMIAHGLAVIREKIFHEPCDAEHCAMLAVYHDAGEVFTGDMPTPVKYFTEDLHDKYKELMKTSANILFLIAMPAVVGMICTSDLLILLFSGKEFISGSFAAKILSVRVLVGAINRILAYQICIPYKKEKDVLVSTIAGAVFNLIANAMLIPVWGTTGASIATLCSEIVVLFVLTFYSKEFFDTIILYGRLP